MLRQPSSTPAAHVIAPARFAPTLSVAVPVGVPAGVLFVVRMPLRALRLGRVGRVQSSATAQVFAVRYKLKMVRANALRIAAEVVDRRRSVASLERPDKQLVSHPMREPAGLSNREHAVAVRQLSPGPIPAAFGDFDSCPETAREAGEFR